MYVVCFQVFCGGWFWFGFGLGVGLACGILLWILGVIPGFLGSWCWSFDCAFNFAGWCVMLLCALGCGLWGCVILGFLGGWRWVLF